MNHKLFFLLAGWFAIALGLAGVFLPILPTTPFVILAAWCFSKSSTRWHLWLLEHRIFGPTISNWEQHGVITLKAKLTATTMIVLLFSYTLIFVNVLIWIKVLVSLIGLGVLYFIWSRPSKAEYDQNL